MRRVVDRYAQHRVFEILFVGQERFFPFRDDARSHALASEWLRLRVKRKLTSLSNDSTQHGDPTWRSLILLDVSALSSSLDSSQVRSIARCLYRE